MKKLLYFILGLVIIVLVTFFVIMNLPKASSENKEADFKTSAQELYTSYSEQEKKANQNYNGKIIEVSGTLVQLDKDQQDATVLILKAGEYGAVMCTLEKEPKTMPELKSEITVKGQCNGFLGDMVVMNKSILLTK